MAAGPIPRQTRDTTTITRAEAMRILDRVGVEPEARLDSRNIRVNRAIDELDRLIARRYAATVNELHQVRRILMGE